MWMMLFINPLPVRMGKYVSESNHVIDIKGTYKPYYIGTDSPHFGIHRVIHLGWVKFYFANKDVKV